MSIKAIGKAAITLGIKHDWFYTALSKTVIPMAKTAEWERQKITKSRIVTPEEIRSISPDLTVKHGPFRGMQLLPSSTLNTGLCPFLLGSYEKELNEIIEQICEEDYSEVVDIGCANGYYVVGLARRLKSARIFGFDIDKVSRQNCLATARANNVEHRISVGSFCDKAALQSLPLTKRALIISDCEGYEKELFDQELMPFLNPHDLLIETHDHLDLQITQNLASIFQSTHNVQVIRSTDDVYKAVEYDYPELDRFNIQQRMIILEEMRSGIQTWLYLKSKMNS